MAKYVVVSGTELPSREARGSVLRPILRVAPKAEPEPARSPTAAHFSRHAPEKTPDGERATLPLPPPNPMDMSAAALGRMIAMSLPRLSVDEPALRLNAMDGRADDLRRLARTPAMVRRAARKMRLTLYVPNNPGLYDAAITGFLAGVYTAVDFNVAPQESAVYAPIVAEAVAFGQAVDGAITAGSPTLAQEMFIGQFSQAVSFQKWTTGLSAVSYDNAAAAIAALYGEVAGSLVPVPSPPVTPSPAIEITASAIINPTADTSYWVNSSSPITVTIASAPDGTRLTFYDESQNWVTYNFSITDSRSGWLIRNADNVAGADSATVTYGAPPMSALNGQSFTIQAINAVKKWLC